MRSARWFGLLPVLLWSIVGVAGPADAEAGLVVTPTTGLTGGDQVTVQASGLPPGATVRVIQCDFFDAFNDPPEEYCYDSAMLNADAAGQAVVDVTLRDPVPHVLPVGDPINIYCRADVCRIFVTWIDATGTRQVLTSSPLEFVGSPATITATPDADLRTGQQLRVDGSALGAEGQTVEVVEEACFDISTGSGCSSGTRMLGSTTVRQDGSWGLNVRVFRSLADGTDCLDTFNLLGQCQLTARILDASRRPDDSFGVSRIGDPGVMLSFRRTAPIQQVTDVGIAPPAPYAFLNPPQRVDVEWAFPATNADWHGIVDASGLGLFDAGLVGPGGSFTFPFYAAAIYPVADPTTGARASVLIPVRLVPAAGPSSSTYTVVWASENAPAGLVYDVRLLRPGASGFTDWRVGVQYPRATFVPDAGPGTYVFEARLRSPSEGAATWWSPYRALKVT